MPNSFAYLMLMAWPVIVVLLFRALPPPRALIWSLLGGYLLLPPLPAAFDFPLLPPLSKHTIPSLSALAAALLWVPRLRLLPDSAIARVLLTVFVLSPVATVYFNPEPLVFVDQALPGLGATDAIALAGNQILLVLGYLLARPLLSTIQAQRDLLAALAIAGIAYSLPMLVEIRLSPQMNLWVYGYYQHLFEQSLRGDGYRPLVFLFHGLWAAFFLMTSLVAATVLLRRASPKARTRTYVAVLYLFVVLVLCKSLGALLYAVALVPLVLLLSPMAQLRVAAIIAVLAVSYPILKNAGLVPAEAVLSLAQAVNPERANSLQFRFDNEMLLQARAAEKPLFGWGSWGRNHLHDPVSGMITTVSDGRWIITFGVYGWVGFLAEFGLLAMPVFLVLRAARRVPGDSLSPYVGALALLLGFNLADLIINATLTPVTWLLSGALLGYAESLRRASLRSQDSPDRVAPPRARRTVL